MTQGMFSFAQDPARALDAQIHDLLWPRSQGALPLPQKVRELLLILQYYKGAEHARPLSEIAAKLKVNEREVKQLVRTLTLDFHIHVGASRQKPYGYFLCVTVEDHEAAWRPYLHEVLALLPRIKELQAPQRIIELLGQLQVELGEDERKAG